MKSIPAHIVVWILTSFCTHFLSIHNFCVSTYHFLVKVIVPSSIPAARFCSKIRTMGCGVLEEIQEDSMSVHIYHICILKIFPCLSQRMFQHVVIVHHCIIVGFEAAELVYIRSVVRKLHQKPWIASNRCKIQDEKCSAPQCINILDGFSDLSNHLG
nr:hypothetical protein Iba_chr12bCG0510 [Ipomoea batatas]